MTVILLQTTPSRPGDSIVQIFVKIYWTKKKRQNVHQVYLFLSLDNTCFVKINAPGLVFVHTWIWSSDTYANWR
jgi:hypothetical protein